MPLKGPSREHAPALRARAPGRLRTIGVRILALIGAAVLIVTATPLVSWWASWYAGAWNDPSGDVMIVLVGDTLDPYLIGRSSYWRSVYAVRAWKAGHFQKVIISGERPASQLMQEYLAFSGVPGAAILIEPASTTTRENALFTQRLLSGAAGSKVLLTSDYHMFRAHRAFERVGLRVLPRPFPDALKRSQRWQNRLEVFFDLLLESAKIVWYEAHGWL